MSQLEFRDTADLHALDVVRDGRIVASLQWHRGRSPRVVIDPRGMGHDSFTLEELRAMTLELETRIHRPAP